MRKILPAVLFVLLMSLASFAQSTNTWLLDATKDYCQQFYDSLGDPAGGWLYGLWDYQYSGEPCGNFTHYYNGKPDAICATPHLIQDKQAIVCDKYGDCQNCWDYTDNIGAVYGPHGTQCSVQTIPNVTNRRCFQQCPY